MKNYLYFTEKEDWRKWLEQNHSTKNEAWLVRYMKHTGKKCISRNDAVDEAICFGWIEGFLQDIDDKTFAQRYSLSKKNSHWSEDSIKSAENMIAQGRMTEFGLKIFKGMVKNGELDVVAPGRSSDIPPDLEKALAANRQALENFRNFPSLRRKQLIWRITRSSNLQMRRDRIKETVLLAERNKYDPDISEEKPKTETKQKIKEDKEYRDLS